MTAPRKGTDLKTRLLAGVLVLVLLMSLTGLVGCGTTEPTEPATEGEATPEVTSARADYFISIDDVAAALEDFVILDARKADAYAAGHVPGAINAPWQPFASVGVGKPGDADWGTLLPPDEIAAKLGSFGVDTSKTIVVYTDPTGWGEDGRVMWTLLSVGITDVKMMDGGYPAWVAAGNETSTEAVTLPATTVKVADKLDATLNATTDEIADGLDTLTIVDVRSTKEYEGGVDYGEARGGHLPGAISMPYPDSFNADGTVKSDEDLLEVFEAAGLTDKDADIVFYCTKGIRSAHTMLLARMLGYDNARNWDASYYDWAGKAELAVE